jgi:hypothetical protein
MIIPADEIHNLECQVRALEHQLAEANKRLIDDYAQAAITGLLAYGYIPLDQVVDRAFKIANLCLEKRKQ